MDVSEFYEKMVKPLLQGLAVIVGIYVIARVATAGVLRSIDVAKKRLLKKGEDNGKHS